MLYRFQNLEYVENDGGWIFREWGFGIGDQIIVGNPALMTKILDVHGGDLLSTRLTRIISAFSSEYTGHTNCGIEAWLNGAECKKSNITHNGFSNPKLLSIFDTNEIFRAEDTV